VTAGGIDQILTVALLNWILRGRDPAARIDPHTGRYSLSYSSRYRRMIVCLVIVTTAFAILGAVVAREVKGPALVLTVTIFGSMWLAGLYAAYDAFLVDLSFGTDGLKRSAAGGGSLMVPWSRVTAVEFSPTANWFTFRSPDARPIRVSIYRNGLATLGEISDAGLKTSPAGRSHYLLHEKARNPG